MKNLSNKTLQVTYGGDVIGGSVAWGILGAFFILKSRYVTVPEAHTATIYKNE